MAGRNFGLKPDGGSGGSEHRSHNGGSRSEMCAGDENYEKYLTIWDELWWI